MSIWAVSYTHLDVYKRQVVKTAAKEEKKQERPSLKERLAQKKDIVAKNEATREPRQMNKDRGQALA